MKHPIVVQYIQYTFEIRTRFYVIMPFIRSPFVEFGIQIGKRKLKLISSSLYSSKYGSTQLFFISFYTKNVKVTISFLRLVGMHTKSRKVSYQRCAASANHRTLKST